MENVRNRKIAKNKNKKEKHDKLEELSEINQGLNETNQESNQNDEDLKGINRNIEKINDNLTKNEVMESFEESKRKLKIKSSCTLQFRIEIDFIAVILFLAALYTRFYKLEQPKYIVFDELHYGKYVSLYMKNTFFFDNHPPLGKQLIAGAAYMAGYDGKFKFDRIGSPYNEKVPLFAMRFIPAFFGSLLIPTAYYLMLETGLSKPTALLGGLLLLLDNAILTQSRFILMESMLIFFTLFGLLCVMRFKRLEMKRMGTGWLILGSAALTCGLCVKYVAFYSFCLFISIIFKDFWKKLADKKFSNVNLILNFLILTSILTIIPLIIYLTVFSVHLNLLYKAGPHDSIMTSAFQASLEGGLASITKGQPLLVAHGSQITLRHTHGRTCWLHSHAHVYPVRYPDKRGSSHQQQVTCYSFKDVNNWWIVKRPQKNDLVVEKPIDSIKHGDIIQLVHGITSRALNSHDVAAPMSPQCQEVSCYIDYNVSMPAQNLWRVEVINRDQNGDFWHTIQSLVRLIHVDSNQALKFSGRQLPEWGFHQHEVVADRIIYQDDTVWNVEEHRYTKSDDQKEREREMVSAEMIPTTATKLSFWDKFFELQYKMIFSGTESVQNHMYSSEPLEWPLMSRGIAYWISNTSNAQIHLLGNLLIWYSSTISLFLYSSLLIFYLLRRRRKCYDIPEKMYENFVLVGEVFFVGYLFHFIPYFFVERTLFLHNYLPAFIFKVLLMAGLIEHLFTLFLTKIKVKFITEMFLFLLFLWTFGIFYVFNKFLILSYGLTPLTMNDIINLRWKDTWDFIVHKH
ncbi:protein O-mannosyltransferase 1 [Onthophagus taurus]|uniref:protein O-mannosyltransferase 1 n=1 Tax=Onthophagus taurus TaxID=166361 RepID=UPI0039BEC631